MAENTNDTPIDKGGANATTSKEGTDKSKTTEAGKTAEGTTDNKGNQTTPPEKVEVKLTQEDFDRALAKARKSGESDALKIFGAKSKDELKAINEKYQATLTEAEKIAKQQETLSNEKKELQEKLLEQDLKIKFLAKGVNIDDIDIASAAYRGLINDGMDENKAFEKVFKLFDKPKDDTKVVGNGGLNQSNSKDNSPNPFTKEHWNLTEQGRLIKENYEKAKVLANAAGIKI